MTGAWLLMQTTMVAPLQRTAGHCGQGKKEWRFTSQ